MTDLRRIYTTDEIALHGEKKLARQWHMTELLQMIAEAEEDMNWSRVSLLEKQYQRLAEQEKE